jgi:hypothetical protein
VDEYDKRTCILCIWSVIITCIQWQNLLDV